MSTERPAAARLAEIGNKMLRGCYNYSVHEDLVVLRNAINERDATIASLQQERDRMRERWHAAVELGASADKERDAATREADALREEVGRLRARADDWEYTVKWMRPRMDKAEYELEQLRKAPAQPSADDASRARQLYCGQCTRPNECKFGKCNRHGDDPRWLAEEWKTVMRTWFGTPCGKVLSDDYYYKIHDAFNTVTQAYEAALTAARAQCIAQGRAEMREIDEPVIETARELIEHVRRINMAVPIQHRALESALATRGAAIRALPDAAPTEDGAAHDPG